MARLLAARGAAVVDADEIARRLLRPGGASLAAVVARFPGAVGAGGVLDRAALAAIVFADPAERRDLEALTHPAIREEMVAEIARVPATTPVVVAVIPLLVESPGPRPEIDAVAVVDCPEEVAMARLAARGMSAGDARARMAAQVGRDVRRAHADHVIDNAGDPDQLQVEVDRCWAWATGLAGAAER